MTGIETEVLASRDPNIESELFPLQYWQISHILRKRKEMGKQIIVTHPYKEILLEKVEVQKQKQLKLINNNNEKWVLNSDFFS